MPYLAYEGPSITVILSLTSFILLLNAVHYVLDQLLYCGIIGEILIGIIYGLPISSTTLLPLGTQEAMQALGYLGLISLVFEGGLTTDLALLKKSVGMSVSVATVGLLMPIALSFVLLGLPFDGIGGREWATPLGAFSAGASLCSTSLGTTFAILAAAGMQKTRVGVVLIGAAMMDDVVGLVMVNIITTLGAGGTSGWPIARPITASFGMLLVTLATVPLGLKPIWIKVVALLSSTPQLARGKFLEGITKVIHNIPHLSFLLSTAVLIVFVTIASFTDASVLLSAFIAGGVVNYLWTIPISQQSSDAPNQDSPSTMYGKYYKTIIDTILVPFFFASIGFSIPITNMFSGSIVWKGIVYSLLMMLAKMLVSTVIYFEHFMIVLKERRARLQRRKNQRATELRNRVPGSNIQPTYDLRQHNEEAQNLPRPPHTIALLAGCAMVARGEIGFLIASLSQSSGTLALRHLGGNTAESLGEDLFLVITWAVVICTIAGPLGVGILVRRLRQGNSHDSWL